MSDFIPKPAATKGLGPKAQKLAALRAKNEQHANGGKSSAAGEAGKGAKAIAGTKKTSFQRKAT